MASRIEKRIGRRRWLQTKIAFYVLVPLVLLLLPVHFFDDGPPMCLFTILTGINCPGCGMTRASMHLIHFDFGGAYAYNRMVFIVFPILAFLWAKECIRDVNRLRRLPKVA